MVAAKGLRLREGCVEPQERGLAVLDGDNLAEGSAVS
jgi:hypothetical protein